MPAGRRPGAGLPLPPSEGTGWGPSQWVTKQGRAPPPGPPATEVPASHLCRRLVLKRQWGRGEGAMTPKEAGKHTSNSWSGAPPPSRKGGAQSFQGLARFACCSAPRHTTPRGDTSLRRHHRHRKGWDVRSKTVPPDWWACAPSSRTPAQRRHTDPASTQTRPSKLPC